MHGVTRRRLDISRPMRYHIDGVNRLQVNFIEVNAMRQFEEGFFVGLSKLERVYKRYFQEAVAEFQFTPNEITVLMFLCNNAPALDTATDIARFKRISKGLVARSVDSLTRRGLLSAQRDERDRRIVHLALSENCAPIAQRLRESERALFAQIAEGIDPVRLEITSDTLRKINQNMNRLLEGETVR